MARMLAAVLAVACFAAFAHGQCTDRVLGVDNLTNMPTMAASVQVPDGYEGFVYTDVWAALGARHPGTGYANGVVSEPNVMLNYQNRPGVISSAFLGGHKFVPVSVFATSVWHPLVEATFEVYDGLTLIETVVVELNDQAPTLVEFTAAFATSVSWVATNIITATPGESKQNVALDNFSFVCSLPAVPSPAVPVETPSPNPVTPPVPSPSVAVPSSPVPVLQCGGVYGPDCACSGTGVEICSDAPWSFYSCPAGTTCVRHSQDFYECRDDSQLQYWAGNPIPPTVTPDTILIPDGGQCGGIHGVGPSGDVTQGACYASGGNWPCTTGQWSWAQCGPDATCDEATSSCSYWQCRPASWDAGK